MIQAPRLFARVLPLVRTWHGCNGYAALGRRGFYFIPACQHGSPGRERALLFATSGGRDYLNGGRWTLVKEFVEIESGRSAGDRSCSALSISAGFAGCRL